MSNHLPAVTAMKLDNGVTVLTIEAHGVEIEVRLNSDQTDYLLKELL